METIKPKKWNQMNQTNQTNQTNQANQTNSANNGVKLTAAEMGKLWATYMGSSMGNCVLKYFLQHVDDQDIKQIVQEALQLTEQFDQTIRDIFTMEKFPMPTGFTEKDVSLDAPRLFADEFYLHYLIYVGKAGMSVYSAAIPLMFRPDVRDFFANCLDLTTKLMSHVNELLLAKGHVIKPPYIPVPEHIEFVHKQSYLNGFFGNVRPLQALEITHLYDSVQNNAISKAILIGFCQVAKLEQIRQYFVRGKEIATKHIDVFSKLLHNEDLPTPVMLDHLVTDSTLSPFSDKLMLFHKMDMFTMRVRTYGNALSFSARHDVASIFGRCLLEVGNYTEDGANNLIDLGWMEQPPQAVDRGALVLK